MQAIPMLNLLNWAELEANHTITKMQPPRQPYGRPYNAKHNAPYLFI